MSYYFSRILNNKIKLSLILLIFLFPVLDIIMTLIDIHNGASAINPDLAAFLGNIIFQGLQKLLLWYLPLLLAIIVSDDCIEDFMLGYKNLLISKWGKKKYFSINMMKSFIVSFLVIFIPLIFNLLMTQITFAGGTYNLFSLDDIKSIPAMNAAFQNPMLTNIIYILFTSVFSGFLGMGSTAISISFHNRFIVYPIVFILWYIPSMLNTSIISAFQPFTEYSMLSVMSVIIFVLIINLLAVAFAFVKVVKYDQL